MAAPEAVRQGAGISASGYSPIVTQLSTPNMGSPGAGELWANVGRTALAAAQQAGDMLQKSPLNPAVKEQMNYAIAQNKAAEDHIQWLRDQGRAGQMMMGTDASGLTTTPAANLAIDPMIRLALRSAPATPPPPQQPPQQPQQPATTVVPKTVTEQPEEGYSASAGVQGPPKEAPPAPSTKPGQKPRKEPSDVLTDNRSASTDNTFGLTRMMEDRGSDAAQQGTPASMTFLNPATGNIEPLKTESPSIYTSQSTAAPPPAPTAPMPSGTGAAAPQPSPGDLAQWQNQNVHPVVAPKAVLDAVRTNVTTQAQDVTYAPTGGVNGEPAWIIGMKGGGQTTISASQLQSSPWGRALMANHNMSEVMEHQAQTTPMPSGTGAAAPQGQPAATGVPPAQVTPSAIAAAQSQANQFAATGGPPPAPGYNAAAYQMPQGPTVTQTGDVNPALMAGGTNQQAAAAASQPLPPVPQITDPSDFNANVRGYSQDQLDKMDKDPTLGTYGGFQWKQDRTYGTKYAVMKSPTSPFKELHWNAGMDQWQDSYKENGQMMEQLQAARANTPLEKMLTDTDIANLSGQDLAYYLDQAVRLNKTGGDDSDTNSLHIRGTLNQSKSLGRTLAMLEAAKQEGINTRLFGSGAQTSSEEAARRSETLPPEGQEYPDELSARPGALWDLGWAALHGMRTNLTGGRISPLADQARAELNYFVEQLGATPALPYTSDAKGEQSKVSLGGGYQGLGGSANIPLPRDTSTLKEINRVSQGNNIDDMISGVKQLKSKIDGDLTNSIERATRLGYRTPPEFKKAAEAIKNGKNAPDPDNLFVDSNGNPQMPEHYKYPPGVAPKIPAPTGPNTQYEDEMQRFYGNRPRPQTTNAPSTPAATPGPTPPREFNSVDDATRFSRNSPSGTIYRVQDSKGVWHTMRVD